MIDDDKPVGSVLEPLRIPQGTSPAFSIVDPAGTWAWQSGPAVQLRAEAAVVELPRRAEAAVQRAALLPVETAVQLRAETAVAELPRRAEAANALWTTSTSACASWRRRKSRPNAHNACAGRDLSNASSG